ncbi:hypothetical protein [Acetobacter sp.]|uniref:hypothetical protein n=1 Tax=Acetobacter sp. TaxID=440 RepID=UPI0039ED74AD
MSEKIELSPELTDLIYVLNGMIEAAMPHIPKQAQLDIGNLLTHYATTEQATDMTRYIAGTFSRHFPSDSNIRV